jgi:hypothetical protein
MALDTWSIDLYICFKTETYKLEFDLRNATPSTLCYGNAYKKVYMI